MIQARRSSSRSTPSSSWSRPNAKSASTRWYSKTPAIANRAKQCWPPKRTGGLTAHSHRGPLGRVCPASQRLAGRLARSAMAADSALQKGTAVGTRRECTVSRRRLTRPLPPGIVVAELCSMCVRFLSAVSVDRALRLSCATSGVGTSGSGRLSNRRSQPGRRTSPPQSSCSRAIPCSFRSDSPYAHYTARTSTRGQPRLLPTLVSAWACAGGARRVLLSREGGTERELSSKNGRSGCCHGPEAFRANRGRWLISPRLALPGEVTARTGGRRRYRLA